MKPSSFVKTALAICAGMGAFLNPAARANPSPIIILGNHANAGGGNAHKDTMIAERIRMPRTLHERELFLLGPSTAQTYGVWPFSGKNRAQRQSLRFAFRCMRVPGY